MGGKAKKKNQFLEEACHQNGTSNRSAPARNLCKKDLGGVILGCTNHTIEECYAKKLFGLPRSHYAYVKKIAPGLPLFLFNYSNRKLHGVFEATSRGQMNIDIRAWTKESFEETPYPAQVKVRKRIDCQPLPEEQFQPIIISNYHSPTHFWFELDQEQTTKLVCLFSSDQIDATLPRAKYPDRQITLEKDLLAFNSRIGGERKDLLAFNSRIGGERTKTPPTGWDLAQPNQVIGDWRSNDSPRTEKERLLLGPDVKDFAAPQHDEADQSQSYANANKFPQKLWSSLFRSNSTSDAGEQPQSAKFVATEAKGFDDLMEEETDNIAGFAAEVGVVASGQCNPEGSVLADVCVSASTSPLSPESRKEHEEHGSLEHEEIARDNLEEGAEVPSLDVGVPEIVAELLREVRGLRLSQLEQAQRFRFIEKELRQKICCLEDRCRTLELRESSAVGPVSETQYESGCEPRPFNKSIFIVGGYDGSSYLSASNLYSPHEDIMTSLSPMRFVRSQASVAKLRGELYVFGGVHGDVWHDTVESYSQEYNEWTDRPSMNRRRGSLGGVSLKDKIFAIGGAAECEPFSDVEMYDPDTGRWICTCSMLCKRLAPAAAELNGILYAIGGYDGEDYLETAERLDPRECSWRPIKDMNTKRGGHSLVVLNQKLYAVGGYDGSRMVATVEVYDPRAGSWMMVESMNEAKANHGVVVIRDVIYILGGLNEGMEVLDTVECYKEGLGWQEIDLKAFGKRCCFSAIVV